MIDSGAGIRCYGAGISDIFMQRALASRRWRAIVGGFAAHAFALNTLLLAVLAGQSAAVWPDAVPGAELCLTAPDGSPAAAQDGALDHAPGHRGLAQVHCTLCLAGAGVSILPPFVAVGAFVARGSSPMRRLQPRDWRAGFDFVVSQPRGPPLAA